MRLINIFGVGKTIVFIKTMKAIGAMKFSRILRVNITIEAIKIKKVIRLIRIIRAIKLLETIRNIKNIRVFKVFKFKIL